MVPQSTPGGIVEGHFPQVILGVDSFVVAADAIWRKENRRRYFKDVIVKQLIVQFSRNNRMKKW
jgi:hypothetical protein